MVAEYRQYFENKLKLSPSLVQGKEELQAAVSAESDFQRVLGFYRSRKHQKEAGNKFRLQCPNSDPDKPVIDY